MRRRRQGQPFERPAVPRIAGDVAPLVARLDRIEQLDDRQHDSQADDHRADQRDVQPRRPGRIGDVLHPPRPAPEAEHVERHEGEVEADEPAPEDRLAEPLVEREAERLREPVGVAGHEREHDAADDHMVEVRDQEQAVVDDEIDRRDGEQNAGQAADRRRSA